MVENSCVNLWDTKKNTPMVFNSVGMKTTWTSMFFWNARQLSQFSTCPHHSFDVKLRSDSETEFEMIHATLCKQTLEVGEKKT